MNDGSCFPGLLIVIGLIILVLYNLGQKQKRVDAARKAYQSSLAQLKQEPSNTDLRQNTLELGRRYAQTARESGRQTVFDEMAMMNDLNAVTGVASQAAGTKAEQGDVIARLKTLEDLKTRGLISDTEYAQRRATILDNI
jgi:hypothetical protein